MNDKRAVGRGAAKVILLGEHAVVHGSTAVAMSLPLGVSAAASRTQAPFRLEAPQWRLTVKAGDQSPSERSLRAIADGLGVSLNGVRLDIDADIPARAGLGASAAVGAAVARALAKLNGMTISDADLFPVVQASEAVFHGTPSGIDATLALGDGVIAFSKKTGSEPLSVEPPRILVVHSGSPGATRHTVQTFLETLKRETDSGAQRLTRIHTLVERGIRALTQGDKRALGDIMVENHEILAWFGVSSPALDRIVDTAMAAGALGAKLTGGGGGGCAIVLPGEREAAVVDRLATAGFNPLSI